MINLIKYLITSNIVLRNFPIDRALLDEAHLRWDRERGAESVRGGERWGTAARTGTGTGTATTRRMEDKPDGRGSNDKDADRPLSGEVSERRLAS